jgi:dual specificity tyrosine-phosphorylation-regulated kinase 2/3/4
MASGGESTLNASSRSKHSLFSFGGSTTTEDVSTLIGYDFLPSVSFDDLHSSIETASNDLQLNQFPAPNGQGSIMGNRSLGGGPDNGGNEGKAFPSGRIPAVQRPGRSGSILRRQSTSTRQSSISSTLSTTSGTMDPPSAPSAVRTRRQSQYPPVSGNNALKAPRKSIGPGVVESDFGVRTSQRRRPSLASTISTQSLSDAGGFDRTSTGSLNVATEGARLATVRAARTKSLQPPSRQGQAHLSTPNMTPEHVRSSSFVGKSPGRSHGRGASTPSSSARRMSILPGMPTSASHATGLGARTVSPTDARRLKRLSTLAGPPPMPNTPPTPQPDLISIGRASSRSPSVLPRKTSTPSSLRTTPDVNRKSYSSGLSTVSNGSYNTARTSTGSLQPRLVQNNSTSRLPTPKPRNVHSSAGNEDEEVPPVPAIPKAYESPKESPAEQSFFNKRKSSLPFDSSSINSSSTNELSGPTPIRDPVKVDPTRLGKNVPICSRSDIDQKTNAAPTKKKHLQPLRLPPLNLLPLSTPTAAKIAALHEPSFSDGNLTPPPKRGNTKTPSTPMTASRALFFSSRNRQDDKTEQTKDHFRSSSSVNHMRESSTIRDVSNVGLTKPITASSRPVRQTVSPFVSSSLPKTSGENTFLPRSNTSGEYTASDNAGEKKTSRLTGPRAQKAGKAPKGNTPTQQSSPDEPVTPSSTTSLRRKLSLGWKRTTSKNSISASHAASERDSEYPPQPPKHDNMPPPRLPASSTINGLNAFTVPSPSPSVKSTTYLDSKRRKSSVSSLSMFTGHDRTRSDSWSISNRTPKKDATVDGGSERPKPSASRTGSSVLSPVHKILNSKASTSALKPQDPWTIDLDKDDMSAEEEMKKLASKRKETEQAARQLDALRKRAIPKDRISPHHAIQLANLNIFERGEIVDFREIYFCGTPNAAKHTGDLQSDAANFGYDDERGDYMIVLGDHLCYRYEIVDILGKGSFGQVVRCVDHKTGGLVAIKIIRNKKRFHQQALVEVNILQKLREWVSQISFINASC